MKLTGNCEDDKRRFRLRKNAALERARLDAESRPPGLVRRNWDNETPVVVIDHEATAADLIDGLPDGCKDLSMADARTAIAYALEGNTEAVLT